MKSFLLLFIAALLFATSLKAQVTSYVSFEDLPLAPESFWNGSDLSGTYVDTNNQKKFYTTITSGITLGISTATFYNVFDTTYGAPGYWEQGITYSNITDTTGFSSLDNINVAAPLRGVTDAINLLEDSTYIITNDRLGISTGQPFADVGNFIQGFYITNTVADVVSMENGDGFAKKFGGATGNDSDWFKVKIKGVFNRWVDHSGVMTWFDINDSIEFYLADFRDVDNTKDYIVKDWQFIDFEGTDLADADSIYFELSSSDIGQNGMNTPAYFCIDGMKILSTWGGIRERSNTIPVKVYPNPTKGNVFVSTAEEIKAIKIFDMIGKKIELKADLRTGKLNTAFLKNGTYFIEVLTEKGIGRAKFIKR